MPKKITQNVNKDKLFNDLPKVKPFMSKWLTKHTNYQSCNLGQIVPIYVDEVLPNEKRKITMGMISHTTTPIAPIFPSMYTEIRAFFVPVRLCVDLLNGYKTRKSPWVKVFGEDNASASSNIIVPLDDQALPEFKATDQFILDVVSFESSYKDTDNVFDSLDLIDDIPSASECAKNNYLTLSAYELIYQRHYRNENYESSTQSDLYKLLFDAYNGSKSSVSLSATFRYEMANREKDYFTGMKPFTQKGDPLTVGLVGSAPVYASAKKHDVKEDAAIHFVDYDDHTDLAQSGFLGLKGGSSSQTKGYLHQYSGTSQGTNTSISGYNDNGAITPDNLWADLKSVNGISIEELRMLIKTQELLEKDALYGSMYAESLNAHFGCAPLDLTLQDPQELYKITITSHMQAIFQTSSTSGESSILGTIGANSTTQTDPFVILPETKFEEHGILMICAVHKLQNVYSSKFFKPRFNFKRERFEFYTPELNDLGYQSVKPEEAKALSSTGYNEAFAEYRYKFNKSHGRLNVDFPYWAPSISDEYASASALYKEGTDILDKSLSVASDTAPQFYDAWGFEEENTKPMTLHSIPGMDGVI